MNQHETKQTNININTQITTKETNFKHIKNKHNA